MKISVNWLRQFTNITSSVDELVVKIGAQLGEVEEVIDLGERYKGILVARVVTCEKHPDADKLSVCKVDDGGANKSVKRDANGYVQVVCGAPNVRAGIDVAWIPPGAIVPNSFAGEQFKLEVRPLRGVDSNGMLASASELGIGDDHSGILVVDVKSKPGASFADLYGLNDYIIDIENKMFTHRPDCFGILGVAREIAGIEHVQFKSPEWYTAAMDVLKPEKHKLKLDLQNELPKLAPRFMAIPMSNVSVRPSSVLMRSYLARVGLKPINNVVDITNYCMYLTAQPLHAYDYDKVAAQDNSGTATIVVRKPQEGEEVALLNGKTIKPNKDAIMIATKKRLIGVAGIMGGVDTEVDSGTKNIILECANFDMYSVRKTSMELGLFTDALTRFSKGQSQLQIDKVTAVAVDMLKQEAGAQVAGGVIDAHGTLPKLATVKLKADFINSRLGLKLSTAEVKKLLVNVEFRAELKNELLEITAPFWRTDIEIAEDIVEEVGRLYGFDRLPLALPKRDITPAPEEELRVLKGKLREVLARAGANELLTYSFVHGDLLEKTAQNKDEAYQISNARSPDLQYYRLSLTPSLLSKVHQNIKAGYSEFALFELGKVHDKLHLEKDTHLPEEMERIALVYASNNKDLAGAAYYQAKVILDYLAQEIGCEFEYVSVSDQPNNNVTAPFNFARSAYVTDKKTGTFMGIIGEYKSSVRKALKLPPRSAGFEIDTEGLLGSMDGSGSYRVLSRFPSTYQDISFKVESSVIYKELTDVILATLNVARETNQFNFGLSALDIYQDEKDHTHKHMAFRVTLSHLERTLVTEEVNSLLDQVANDAHASLKAIRL